MSAARRVEGAQRERPRRTAALAVPEIPISRFRLRCGALLLVSPRRGAPVCAFQAHLRGGHGLDPLERQGTAFLAGRLVEQGTERHTEEELADLLETAGGEIAGSSTGLAGSIAGEEWRLLLELAAECLTVPSYPRDELERERKRLLDQLLVERDDPRTQGAWKFRRLVYGDHWLGRPEYGGLDTVPRIERRHVAGHHRRHWVASRAILAFCGDVEPEDVRRFLDRKLRHWPAGRDLPPPAQDFPPRAPRVDAFEARRQQVHVFLGHLGIRRSDPDYAPLVVMDHVLGTGPGFTNRISRHLRDELGLAYSVHASIHASAGVLPGTFTAYIGTSPERVATAVRGFLAEIRRIQEEPVGAAELELIQSYLTGSFPLGFERASRRVRYMVSAERHGFGPNHLRELVESFARVTSAEVQRVARAHLHPADACLVAAGPVAREALERLLPAGPRSGARGATARLELGRGGARAADRTPLP
jgi:zinc protease